MTVKWIKTAHKGLRYYEHQQRKQGKQRDRYYMIRFRVDGVLYSYGVGWLSDGIPDAIRQGEPGLGFQDYCLKLLRQYKGNIKIGEGPKSPKEKRQIAEEKETQEKIERERLERGTITFADFFDKTYLPQVKLDRPKSARADAGLYNSWLKSAIGSLPFSQISPFHIEKLKKTIADAKRSPRTIEYALAIVRQIFNYARSVGVYSGASPTAMVKRPKIDNARMRYLTPDEADRLLKALAARSRDVHDMALLSLHCGLRYGEIASLQWQDVNFDQNALTIRYAKTGSRPAFLTDKAREILGSRMSRKPEDYVFPARQKIPKEKPIMSRKPIISQTFPRVVKDIGLNTGITDRKLKVTFHTLRHTHGTILYEATHDLYLVQKSLGHKTATMAQRYAKMTEGRLRDAAKVLNKALQVKEIAEPDQTEQAANESK